MVVDITTDLLPETRDNRLHKHEYKAKEINRNNATNNHDDDLTYATSSLAGSDEPSENEHDSVQTSLIVSVCETSA